MGHFKALAGRLFVAFLLAVGVMTGAFSSLISTATPAVASAVELSEIDVQPAIQTVTHYVAGAGSGGKVPTTPQVMPDGNIMKYVDYSADPLDMPNSSKEGADKLLANLTPDETGVCRVAAYSLGTIATVDAMNRVDRSVCPKLDIVLGGSPNGDGSLAELLPDIPGLIDFNEGSLSENIPADADVTVTNMKNDGFASCKNQLSSLVTCTVGAFAGHYCAFEDLIPGQCYTSFDGEWLEYEVDGVKYRTADTRNPVAVGVEYLGKQFDPNFGFTPEQDAQFEAYFPQGMPGEKAEGITLRDVFQPDLAGLAEDAGIEVPYIDPTVVETGVQVAGTVATTVATVVAPEVAPVIAAATPVVAEVAAGATEWYNTAFETVAPAPSNDYVAPVGGLNDLAQAATDLVGSVSAATSSLGGTAAPSMSLDVNTVVNDINTAAASLLGGFQLP